MTGARTTPLALPYALLAAGVLASLLAGSCGAADDPPPRDAAEVVKEGDVSQWLKHYQRERGEDWSKQTPSAPQPAPRPAEQPVPPQSGSQR